MRPEHLSPSSTSPSLGAIALREDRAKLRRSGIAASVVDAATRHEHVRRLVAQRADESRIDEEDRVWQEKQERKGIKTGIIYI